MEIIRVENLYKNYITVDGQEIEVLKNISFVVKEKEFCAIMGKSGCGKTTLLKTMGVIEDVSKGKIFLRNDDIAYLGKEKKADIRRNCIGFVFQDYYLMDSLTVKENISLPMILDKRNRCEIEGKVTEFAKLFDISGLMDKYPYELSGGEKQRTAICRALVNNPELILADEPTGNLDTKSGKKVIEEMKKINTDLGKTIIMVTHDPKVASNCNRVIFLKDGIIMEEIEKKGSDMDFYYKIVEKMENI